MSEIKVRGIRKTSIFDGKGLFLYFDRALTDEEIHLIHDIVRDGLARGDAYQGAREDMEIWKKRALEAEQIIDRMHKAFNAENGPVFMGEPVIKEPQQ